MNAIASLSSFGFRSSQGASLSSTVQQAQTQRGTFNTSNSGVSAARGNSNTSSASCPTCGTGGSRSAASSSSSYCPTCNRVGGAQSSMTTARTATAQTGAAHAHQSGRTCVGCAYQGR